MQIKVTLHTSEDVIFEGALLLAPVSNYSNGEDKGERPAIRWAMMRLSDNLMRGGLFNIKGLPSEDTAEKAVAVARTALFDGDGCMGLSIVDAILEEYEREV